MKFIFIQILLFHFCIYFFINKKLQLEKTLIYSKGPEGLTQPHERKVYYSKSITITQFDLKSYFKVMAGRPFETFDTLALLDYMRAGLSQEEICCRLNISRSKLQKFIKKNSLQKKQLCEQIDG